jgi:hypothetical protein
MPRKLRVRALTLDEQETLERLSRSRTARPVRSNAPKSSGGQARAQVSRRLPASSGGVSQQSANGLPASMRAG